jgi:hypothetical protein
MAHMIFQRIATAIREAYTDRDDVETQLDGARAAHAWAEGLAVDSTTRAGLLEPITAVEDGLREVLRRRSLEAVEG